MNQGVEKYRIVYRIAICRRDNPKHFCFEQVLKEVLDHQRLVEHDLHESPCSSGIPLPPVSGD